MIDIMDLHTHTIVSGHAYNTLNEMILSAADKGISLLGVTEHGPAMPGACHPYYYINFKVIPRLMYGVRLLMGCELNIMDYEGNVDLKPAYLEKLDFGIASLHPPLIASGTMAQNTAAVIGAMKNPAVHIIGHPDDGRFPVDYETVVCAAKEHHVLLEVNNTSLYDPPRTKRKNSRENCLKMLEYCRKYQVSVILDSDAHYMTDVASHANCHALLAEAQFPLELVANRSLEAAAAFIPALKNMLTGESRND